MEHMKHSTSRDFRIDAASLQSALQEQASSEEEEEENETVANEPNDVADNAANANQVNIFNFSLNLDPQFVALHFTNRLLKCGDQGKILYMLYILFNFGGNISVSDIHPNYRSFQLKKYKYNMRLSLTWTEILSKAQ